MDDKLLTLWLSQMTWQSSTNYAILPACLAAFNFSRWASRFLRVESTTSSLMCELTGFSFQAFLRTCSRCFQSQRWHTIVCGSFVLALPFFFCRSTRWALSMSISKSSLALIASLIFYSTSSQVSFSPLAIPLIQILFPLNWFFRYPTFSSFLSQIWI